MTITEALLAEIRRKGSTRESIAVIYGRGIAQCLARRMDEVDWHLVNEALLKRFTPSGLDHIKKRAWQLCKPVYVGEGITLA